MDMTPTRALYVFALLVAYFYLAGYQLFVLVPVGADPRLEQFWYGSLVASLVPPFVACMFVGWIAGWRRSLLHGVAMGAVSVTAYALIDVVQQPETYAESVTWKTAPFFFLGLSAFYLLGTMTGWLLHFVWRKLGRTPASSAKFE